jgi:hypothetical protein
LARRYTGLPCLEGSETSLLLLAPRWYAIEPQPTSSAPSGITANTFFPLPLARIFANGPLRAKENTSYLAEKYPIIVSRHRYKRTKLYRH